MLAQHLPWNQHVINELDSKCEDVFLFFSCYGTALLNFFLKFLYAFYESLRDIIQVQSLIHQL